MQLKARPIIIGFVNATHAQVNSKEGRIHLSMIYARTAKQWLQD